MSRIISRDPFARTELHRETFTGFSVDVKGGFGDRLYECHFCGNVRRSPNGHPQAYRFSTVTDGGRAYQHKGSFCCKACHDAYHN